VLVQVFFGLFPLLGKWALEAFSPASIAGWRMLFGGAVFMLLAVCTSGRSALPRARDLPLLVACALLGVVFNQLLFLEGLSRSSAVNAGLLIPLIPVYTLLIAVVVGQERFIAGRALGIAVALAGAAQLLFRKDPDLGRAHLVGNAMFALNAFSYSCYLVASRPLLARYRSLVVVAWVFALSALFVPLFPGVTYLPSGAGKKAWISLGLILLFPTVLAYLLNTFALARVSASTTAVYTVLQPLITGVTGVAFLGEHFGPGSLLAAVLIFLGLYLVIRRPAGVPLQVPPPAPSGDSVLPRR
jgi:drug/metabolite transporter (DMT)-like permease